MQQPSTIPKLANASIHAPAALRHATCWGPTSVAAHCKLAAAASRRAGLQHVSFSSAFRRTWMVSWSSMFLQFP